MQKASKDFNAYPHPNTMLLEGKFRCWPKNTPFPEKAFGYITRILKNSSTFKETFQFHSFQKYY